MRLKSSRLHLGRGEVLDGDRDVAGPRVGERRTMSSAAVSVAQSGHVVCDDEESEARRRGLKEAELTLSADSVRTYLQQIGKIALLGAGEEVELAQRIEAGLFATERVRRADEVTGGLAPQLRRDLRWIIRDGAAPRTICWRPTCAWWCRWPSATPAAGGVVLHLCHLVDPPSDHPGDG